MTQNSPFALDAHDPGPIPLDAPRMFAPVAAGDVRTSAAYLSTALIRLSSAGTQGEAFTGYEMRAILAACTEISEMVGELRTRLEIHRQAYPNTGL